MSGSFYIMVVTWVSFSGQVLDIPSHYFPVEKYDTRSRCEDKLKEYFAGENNYRLETIKTAKDEIVLRVISGTSTKNTFITCLEVRDGPW